MDYLERECADPAPVVRSEALARLRHRDGVDAAGRILAALRDDPEETVRSTAFELLCELGGRFVIRAVLDALGDRSEGVRRRAEAAAAGIDSQTLLAAIPLMPEPLAARARQLVSDRNARRSSQPPHKAPSAARASGNGPVRSVSKPAPLRQAQPGEVDRLLRQCLHGSPDERAKAADSLALVFVQRSDYWGREDSLWRLWSEDCPLIGPLMTGFHLNSDLPCTDPPRRTSRPARSTLDPKLVAKVESVLQSHPEPSDFLAHVGGETKTRCAAIHLLGQCGRQDAQDALVDRVLHDKSSSVAAAAATALADLQSEEPLLAVRGRMSLADFQSATAQQPRSMQDRLKPVLLDDPVRWHGRQLPSGYDLQTVAEAVARGFSSRPSPELDIVVQAVAAAPSWAVRVAAARALVDADQAAAVGLADLLDSRDAAAPVLAAWCLARRPDDWSRNALAKALNSPSALVRRTAALGLRTNGARQRLAVRLKDPDYVVRWLAARAACELGTQLDALGDALDDCHPEVIRAASAALLVAPEHERRIRCGAASKSEVLRGWTARLQHLAGEATTEQRLEVALQGTGVAERVVATYNLRRGPKAGVLLPLLRLLHDPCHFVRHAAALALMQLAPTASAELLQEIAEHDRADFVRDAARQALNAVPAT